MKGLTISTCRRRLVALWLIGSAVLFVVILLQTVFGHYGNEPLSAWRWFAASLGPNLSLMIGVLLADDKRVGKAANAIGRFVFRIAFSSCLFYLLALLLVLLLQPFAVPSGDAVDYLKASSLWLTIPQGVATGILGWFFVSARTA